MCVAFCEAQDFAALSDPITEAELDALEDSAPSGKILANYNKKKQDGDPDMPCIKVEEQCPCWSASELNEIDGIMHDGSLAQNTSCQPGRITRVSETGVVKGASAVTQAFLVDYSGISSPHQVCGFSRVNNGPVGSDISITRVWKQNGGVRNTMTFEQLLVCKALIDAKINEQPSTLCN